MRNYDELLDSARKAQREKLEENGHKCEFDQIPIVLAISRTEDEIEELYDAHDEFLFSKKEYEAYPTDPVKAEITCREE